MNRITGLFITILLSFLLTDSFAQEVIIPLYENRSAKDYYSKKSISLKSALDITLELPVIDDFSNYLVEPDPDIWSDKHAFINTTYSVNPLTIGVATLDAIDFDGSFYPHATIDPNTFISDYLTTHPINLNYPPSDSIYLSFFYQPEGLGEMPEPQDSLSVQFYDVQEEKWNTIWQIPGDTLHDFKLVMIPVTESKYLQNGFRFRFKNLASLSRSKDFPDYRGNVDFWNIDYVKLDRLRSFRDTVHRDVAFIQPLPSILKGLESLPWKHFQAAYNTAINSVLGTRYLNNDTITRNVTRGLSITDLVYGGTIVPGQPTAQDLPPLEDTVVKYIYIYPFDFDRGESGLFEFTASLRTDVFDNKNNDTVTRIQVFKDYYAYDDGTAEFGYGIRGQGTKNGKVALKYNMYKPDLLAGVDLYFNQVYDSLNLDNYFKLIVWDDNEGVPGSIIYQDEKSRKPKYSESINGLTRLQFEELVPVEGVIYVGWTQTYEYLINIGLDINTRPSNAPLFYNIGDGWKSSEAPGIIMLRPFIHSLSNNTQLKTPETLRLYPNPATEIIHFDAPGSTIANNSLVEIYDLRGRLVLRRNLSGTELNVSSLDSGLYIIRVRSGSDLFNSKLLISK